MNLFRDIKKNNRIFAIVSFFIFQLSLTGLVAKNSIAHERFSQPIVRIAGDTQQTRLVLEYFHSPKSIVHHINETQTRVSFANIHLKKSMAGQGSGLIKNWKLTEKNGKSILELSFNSKVKISKRFILPPADGLSTYRYVIDFSSPEKFKENTIKISNKSEISPSPLKKLTKKTIIIDAGHGGKDPGAVQEHDGIKYHEKNITLDVAIMLKDKLEKTGRYTVILTRDDDEYVSLNKRVLLARSVQADLFISLHADSTSHDKTVRGASVYTLSESGTTRAAKKALIKGDWSLNDQSKDEVVNKILIDLNQRATKNRSSVFAQLLIDHLVPNAPVLKSSLRQAGFMVLLAPDVPAVLLEMGFLSNSEDAKLLSTKAQRSKIALSVSSAIDQYFSLNGNMQTFASLTE